MCYVKSLADGVFGESRFQNEIIWKRTSALELARQERFDAVIIDIVMPNLDGIGLTRELLKIHPGLPVMIMTGYAHAYPVSAALAAGATESMAKPFTIAQFTLQLANMMKHARGTNSKT